MLRAAMFTTVTLALMLAWTLPLEPLKAELVQPEGFEPDELVGTLEFTIQVGADGELLAEPVAIDLGLGFPFWLFPIGKDQAEGLPIGATPQEGPEQAELQPGESATFVFRREGDPGGDVLRRTPQLLDGVRVSDIARFGVISLATSDWELAGYELAINGKTFVARDDVRQRARESIEQAEIQWIEAREALEGFAEEREDLRALEEAGLATEEDLARLEAIQEETRPLEKASAWGEGVSLGIYPWFVERGLTVPGREESGGTVEARVILSTAPHANGETYNHLYFRTGGRKFFLYPPSNHFTPDANPQAFELNVGAGPLSAGDVRGFALGMLAHDRPYAAAPDRWHPERLVVELGGRVVYDSESEPIDQRSLEVIRLIPPAHVDGDGEIIVNEPNPRECLVWHSGHGQGLDLDSGGPAEIPGGVSDVEPEPTHTVSDGLTTSTDTAPDRDVSPDRLSPDGEPVTTDDGVAWDPGTEIPGQGGDCWPGESPLDPDDFPGFPPDDVGHDDIGGAEDPWGTDSWSGGGMGGDTWGGDPWGGSGGGGGYWDGSGGSGGNPWGTGSWCGWGFGFGSGGLWGWAGSTGPPMPWNGIPDGTAGGFPGDNRGESAWDLLAARLADLVAALLEALGRRINDAEAFGEPPQIDNVHLVRQEGNPRSFQVAWSVQGDESQIQDYEVSLWHIRPETEDLYFADVTPLEQSTVPAARTLSEWMEPTEIDDRAAYIQPMVVARLNDGSSAFGEGDALPWIAPEADAFNQPQPDSYTMMSIDPETGEGGGMFERIPDVEPEGGRAGVWAARVLPNNSGVDLATTPRITSNVAIRGTSDGIADVTVDYLVHEPLDPTRLYELIGHVGYLEESVEGAFALVEVCCTVSPQGGASGGAAQPREDLIAEVDVSSSDPPRLFTATIDPAVFPEGGGPLRIKISIPQGNNDPAAPLAIYGLRLLPVDQ